MAFHVRISSRAKRDLIGISDWLLEHGAGETGIRWFEGLQEAIVSLEANPRRCTLAPESETLSQEVRHLLYGSKPHLYRILFTTNGHAVMVLSIRHGRRLPLAPH